MGKGGGQGCVNVSRLSRSKHIYLFVSENSNSSPDALISTHCRIWFTLLPYIPIYSYKFKYSPIVQNIICR